MKTNSRVHPLLIALVAAAPEQGEAVRAENTRIVLLLKGLPLPGALVGAVFRAVVLGRLHAASGQGNARGKRHGPEPTTGKRGFHATGSPYTARIPAPAILGPAVGRNNRKPQIRLAFWRNWGCTGAALRCKDITMVRIGHSFSFRELRGFWGLWECWPAK